MPISRFTAALLLGSLLGSCGLTPDRPVIEGASLFGRPLEQIVPEGDRLERLKGDLSQARSLWSAETNEANAIWVGRRLGYLGRYSEAIEWFTARLQEFPGSYRLLRHRGHRHISLREFARAEVDLTQAWALARDHPNRIEPDGAPNAFNIPRSTDHGNILYHLALAIHLQGRWEESATAWTACQEAATNDDSRASALNWRYQALMRAARPAEAREAVSKARADWDVIENLAYLDLCLLYAGRLEFSDVVGSESDAIQDVTRRYGVSAWRYAKGEVEEARADWSALVESGPWNAFGVIAAEADLARAR
jgi:tetratricopeptide (TPR) repeat protein